MGEEADFGGVLAAIGNGVGAGRGAGEAEKEVGVGGSGEGAIEGDGSVIGDFAGEEALPLDGGAGLPDVLAGSFGDGLVDGVSAVIVDDAAGLEGEAGEAGDGDGGKALALEAGRIGAEKADFGEDLGAVEGGAAGDGVAVDDEVSGEAELEGVDE